jgi:hypothetical protein
MTEKTTNTRLSGNLLILAHPDAVGLKEAVHGARGGIS